MHRPSPVGICTAKLQPQAVKGVRHLLVPFPEQLEVLEAEVQEVVWGRSRAVSRANMQGLAMVPVDDAAVGG